MRRLSCINYYLSWLACIVGFAALMVMWLVFVAIVARHSDAAEITVTTQDGTSLNALWACIQAKEEDECGCLVMRSNGASSRMFC